MASTLEEAASDAATDGGEVLVLALLREAAPLDVGEALLFSVRGAPRLHDGLGVGGRRGGGGAAHLCWRSRELRLDGVRAALGLM